MVDVVRSASRVATRLASVIRTRFRLVADGADVGPICDYANTPNITCSE